METIFDINFKTKLDQYKIYENDIGLKYVSISFSLHIDISFD